MVSSRPRPYFNTGKDPVPIVQEAGWVPGPVWRGGKSRPIRIRSPDRPARSQSLYRLRYQAHNLSINLKSHIEDLDIRHSGTDRLTRPRHTRHTFSLTVQERSALQVSSKTTYVAHAKRENMKLTNRIQLCSGM